MIDSRINHLQTPLCRLEYSGVLVRVTDLETYVHLRICMCIYIYILYYIYIYILYNTSIRVYSCDVRFKAEWRVPRIVRHVFFYTSINKINKRLRNEEQLPNIQ